MTKHDRSFFCGLHLLTVAACSEIPFWWRVVLFYLGTWMLIKSGGSNG